MEQKPRGEKTRTSYFSNVKTRLGSKLPPSSQPPGFIAWETPCCDARPGTKREGGDTPGTRTTGHPQETRPHHHVPHIRNPQLREYYLREATWLPEAPKTKPEEVETSNGRVRPDDTVFSVASQFHTTPTQLVHLNKLPNNTLIPGQRLIVPESMASTPPLQTASSDPDPDLDPPSTPAPAPSCSPLSPSPDAEYDKLLDVEAVPMLDGQLCLLALPAECSEGAGPTSMPYLKLGCRYITDRKGVVSGVLLVTPNKIFFDPYKSHPLVMENGCEEYLLSCCVDSIISVSFYSDISHVHFNTSTQRWKGRKRAPNPKAMKNLARRFHGAKHGHAADHKGKAVLALVSSATADLRSASSLNLNPSLGGLTSEEHSTESQDTTEAEKQQETTGASVDELAAQSAGMLGVAVLSSAATFCCGGVDVGDKVNMELVHLDGMEQQQGPGKGPAGLSHQSSGSSGSLMFVRLRLRLPPSKKRGVFLPEPGVSKTAPTKDAWFALAQQSSDELYAYLTHWRSDLCILEGGEEEEGEGEEEEFVLVDDREQEEGEGVPHSDSRTGEDWEMVSVEDEGGKTLVVDKDPEGLSDILEQSRILEAEHVREISSELPPRTVGHAWHLSYSTSRHGSSLKSLYRKLAGTESPVLIVIKDSQGQVFGSFLSHPLRPSETFYGTGETFLFMLHPRFKCFRWTGENSFFIKGDLDSFAIGGGSGHFGLWLDEALYLGRSSPCHTFSNCCLSETDDFRVMEMEVWTFC
ncbi:oxidation resistance protein 1 isoform X2 [Megalops cyprinoides]|uniref:oxidation resistance protein 1 isoform X2 n=1 Tax=Megalops cyprinoides TaxID=118141 RepID=UPI001863EB4E|nr:oxidation resistance protein 1 isoform X2 [Megalops cyprinoides]